MISDVKLKLKQYRKMHGLTQADVAIALGLEPKTYEAIENGRVGLTLINFAKLCEILKVSPNDLISCVDDETKEDTKEKWIDEICCELRKMNMEQVGQIKVAISALND